MGKSLLYKEAIEARVATRSIKGRKITYLKSTAQTQATVSEGNEKSLFQEIDLGAFFSQHPRTIIWRYQKC